MAETHQTDGLTPKRPTPQDSLPWQRLLRQAGRAAAAFPVRGETEPDTPPPLPVRIPAHWLQDLDTKPALARQVVPSPQELQIHPEERSDPIGDERHSPVPGITHRYADRVLLKLNHHCAMYCRFCFRNQVVGQKSILSAKDLDAAVGYIRANPNIWEVILTGGDPLVLPEWTLFDALEALGSIEHVACLRFHTRVPTALPQRITPELVQGLQSLGERAAKTIWMVVHINSADELTPDTAAALRRLIQGGVPLLSQSVLLAGVNDAADKLEALFRGLVRLGIKPYYLHLLDLALGTHHFRVPMDQALDLFRSLRGRMAGTCLPTLVLDIPGGHGKVDALGPQLRRVTATQWQAQSPLSGQWIDIHYPA